MSMSSIVAINLANHLFGEDSTVTKAMDLTVIAARHIQEWATAHERQLHYEILTAKSLRLEAERRRAEEERVAREGYEYRAGDGRTVYQLEQGQRKTVKVTNGKWHSCVIRFIEGEPLQSKYGQGGPSWADEFVTVEGPAKFWTRNISYLD